MKIQSSADMRSSCFGYLVDVEIMFYTLSQHPLCQGEFLKYAVALDGGKISMRLTYCVIISSFTIIILNFITEFFV